MPKSRTDQVVIRHARQEDVETLVGFSAAMASETESRSLDRERLLRGTQAVLESPDRGFYLVAEMAAGRASGQIVGQLLITYEWSDWRNGVFWWVQSVYVHPDWRGHGVYRRMHEFVVAQARMRKDVCGIRLYVEGENRVAKAVYAKVELLPTTYQVFEDDFLLKRNRPHDDSSETDKSGAPNRRPGKGKRRI